MKQTLVSLSTLTLLSALAPAAHADANAVAGGIAGGVVGAELIMLGESAFRVRPTWAYLAGGGAGAALGAYVGHELSDDGSNRPPAFLIAGSIALVIPTLLGVLTATQYAPPGPLRDHEADEDALNGTSPEGPHLELPEIGVAQAFSREKRAQLGLRQVTELHLSLLRGAF